MGRIRIGISGWRYPPWRKAFYPEGLPQRLELEYAAQRFASIELNGSFYSLQRPSSYLAWREATPEDFVFAIKGTRYVTHLLRLKDAHDALANFFASGVLALGDKLGPFLWQLPPSLKYDAAVLEDFLTLLPRDGDAAYALARQRDRARMQGRKSLRRQANRPLRHAVEVRHDSFACAEFVEQMRRHGAAIVVADTAGRWPRIEDLTADFVYLRLHGDAELYRSGYSGEARAAWAARIRAWSAGRQVRDAARVGTPAPKRATRDVYCYFDNDVKVRAPYDARALATQLGLAEGLPSLEHFTPPPSWAEGLGPRARARMPGSMGRKPSAGRRRAQTPASG